MSMQTNSQEQDQHDARQLIVAVGRRMDRKNLVAAHDGNISCREDEDTIWVTPTGVFKGFLSEDMLLRLRLDGTVLNSGPYKPSSEIQMHLRIYNENPEVSGIIHAHPPFSTAFAIAGKALDTACYSETVVSLGVVPCVHYETPGSKELADAIAPYCRDYHALLLANHGALTWGRTLREAYTRLETLEHYAQILLYSTAFLGKANILSADQVDALLAIREKQGIPSGGTPLSVERPDNLEDILPGGTAQSLELPANLEDILPEGTTL